MIIISALFYTQAVWISHTLAAIKKCDDITFKFSFALKQQNDPKEDAKEWKDESQENAKAVQMWICHYVGRLYNVYGLSLILL